MTTLDSYHIMIVSKYFKTIEDYINLELVCKKCICNMEKFHFNPIPLSYKTIKYFPNIETLHLWHMYDENFGNEFLVDHQNDKCHQNIIKCNNVVVTKSFYQIVVWFHVYYPTVDQYKNLNFKFKNVIYTQNDRIKFGNTIPLCVTQIGLYCFNECQNLSSIILPSNVTSLGFGCFSCCKYLSNIVIPTSVISIDDYCFYECRSLSDITIPINVTTIGDYCFSKCNCLSYVNIPSNVISLGFECFDGCSSLSSVVIPLCYTSIDENCFPANTKIYDPNGLVNRFIVSKSQYI
ncbi:hypothetical protein EIN_522300 [Entamoeba invadens IP1]|uniref:Leucine rich repeat containing protein BspA family protein n=1 Tax=Entamoeba invadens IP1 TaxID=370355 RepID=A0A0A1UFM8_ENTIV|nr:hypothetical protein EIN_522300 [Entamoeba invadens IP1]ELP91753.1 hypothetical protein EIN_522300 [Entamoeba invadens IP1]|eukprot:XP_004258524.1 hypothetical protein EIN_522300 [Entamoeba invadens IP1]